MRRSLLVTLVLSWWMSPAVAVLPPESLRSGGEPVRIRTADRAMQSFLDARPAWRAFTDADGAGWEVRWDEVSWTPHRMWGPGIPLGALPDEDAAGTAVLGFVTAHAALLGVEDSVPVVRRAAHDAGTDTWYVHVDALVDGLRVWRGGITARVTHGKLVMVGAETYPGAPVAGEVRVTGDAAITAFIADGPAPTSTHDGARATLELLPRVAGGRATLRRVWHVQTRTRQPAGRWHAFVDAETGVVVAFYNDVRFVDGTLTAEIDTRLGDGELTTATLRGATVTTATGTTTTDELGAWLIDGEGPATLSLEGPGVRIVDAEGAVTPTLTGGSQLLTAADFDGRQASLSAFTFVQQVQDYARTVAPEVEWVDTQAVTRVNRNDTCNAWFDGTLNFMSEGGGCRNTARLADVVYHEWGHGFHFYSLLAGDYDGSLGEGAADTMSSLMTDDHRLAPSFFLSGTGALRDVLNDRRYPDDVVEGDMFVHSNGLVFGGSMWDTRMLLEEELGAAEGKAVFAALFARLLKGGPDIASSYDEAVFADDDDDDLSNGTPHRCQIVEGFGRHGLGPLGGIGFEPQFEAAWNVPSQQPATLTLTIGNPAPECVSLTPAGGTLHWRVNGGAWQEAPLDVEARDVIATIPGAQLELGDLVEWWSEVTAEEGARIVEPSSGQVRPHTFYVGDVLALGCQDFEADDGGYTHKLVDGEDAEGADDWTWGTPIGLAGDPSAAASGDRVWGNDLGGGDYNGEYQNGKRNRLLSPVLDTAWYADVILRYSRWLTIEDGLYDQARIFADEQVVWANWQGDALSQGSADHHVDNQWETHVVPLQGQADDGSVRLVWELETDQGLSFGGWTLDDVCLFAPATTDNRLGIGDFTAVRSGGDVDLAWTSPKWGPVERVRVVRKVGDWPTGPEDGTSVYEVDAPDLDAPMSFTDETGRKDLFYAVYATDGDAWLSWTREGMNAAAVDIVGEPGRGCDCDGSGTGGAVGAAGLLGALLVRRRRRA